MVNVMKNLRDAAKVLGQTKAGIAIGGTAKDVGQDIAKAGKYVANKGAAAGQYVKDASEYEQRGGGVRNGALAPFRVLGNATADAAIGTGKKMVRDTDPSIANLWTGKRESGFGIGVAAVGAIGYAGYQSMQQTALAPRVGTVSYGGAAPIMDADGVSSTPQAPLSNAPTLGANGNMVFGLHNARKG